MNLRKAFGVAAMGFALAGPAMPQPAVADGAISKSTVYRGRNKYGPKILSLQDAVNKGDFAAFEDKKVVNAFDLFISSSNALPSKISKDTKKTEIAIQTSIYEAVKAKDSAKLKSSFSDFVKLADLVSDYKPGELGQTDSSGNSPTWGTPGQYIYQR